MEEADSVSDDLDATDQHLWNDILRNSAPPDFEQESSTCDQPGDSQLREDILSNTSLPDYDYAFDETQEGEGAGSEGVTADSTARSTARERGEADPGDDSGSEIDDSGSESEIESDIELDSENDDESIGHTPVTIFLIHVSNMKHLAMMDQIVVAIQLHRNQSDEMHWLFRRTN
ncbi:hypothetical protein BBJ28_00023511 [Nothophytophthora sp. Chile5]|nr:hypothetical protein BBJ28_00023511 [Nothophytophthora sp. Chile5]